MHIASLDNLSLLLEENVRSAFFGQVGVICARRCQTTSKHSVTFGGLKKDFHLHAKFNLGTKKKITQIKFFLQVSRVHRGHKNKAFKRRPRHKQTLRSIFAVKIFCLWRDGLSTGSDYLWHLTWEAVINIILPFHLHTVNQIHRLNCVPCRAWFIQVPGQKIIYHKCNKSPHTVNRFPLQWCHYFYKDTNLPHLQKSNSSFSKDLAKQQLFEFIFYYSFHVSSHMPYVLTFLALKKHVELSS